jgi:predicted enzyme related to lactoylglutathione lyase
MTDLKVENNEEIGHYGQTLNRTIMGRIVHFELPADNPEKMIDFYTKVFKWKFQKWAENDYWLTDTGQSVSPAINGAIVKRQGHFRNLIKQLKILQRTEGQL